MDTSLNTLSSEQAQAAAEAMANRTLGSAAGGGGSVRFLSTVKKIQRDKRKEQQERRRSSSLRPSFFSSNLRNTTSTTNAKYPTRRVASERTPLTTTTPAAAGGGGGGGGGDIGEEIDDDDYDDFEEDQRMTTTEALADIIMGKGVISWCLLAAPFAIYSHYASWSDTIIFWLNFITMIPLAAILGDFTEEVALHTNETIGGLINASFGNAVEVVVAVQALLANEIRVVQGSLLGSIFSNLLLVLGCCFFFGGLYHKEQKFNATAATANMGLLALSSIALVLPTPFAEYYDLHDEDSLAVSRIAAIFLMFMYIQLLVFQLHTHVHLFDENGNGDNNEDQELANISFGVSIVGLLVTTLLVALFSEYLVASIDGFTESSGFSRTFVGIILLPIVGNAVEHVTAVTVAMKDKMDLAMGVAIGSSTQISLLVVPLTVLVGWVAGKDMSLNFPHFEIILYIMSVLTVSIVLSNPSCNWLEGSLLITTYLLIAVGFWFENVVSY